jgi:ADP-heptose:LPS heptosyltransferase
MRRILVIRIDERVGNLLLTTPLLDALLRWFPDAQVDVLVAASKRSVIDGIGNPIPFEKRDLFRRPIRFARQVLALRRSRYDAVIDASHWHRFSLSSAMLLAWTGAPLRIAHDRGPAARFATALIPAPAHPESEIRTKLALMEPLGVEAGRGEMRTALGGGSAGERMAAWLAEASLAPPIVAVFPGARKIDHRVDAEIFASLAREARRLGGRAVIVWGPGEQALGERVASASGAVLAPPTDLEEAAALLRRSAVAITNDTGPMHLSVACGTPTIALFTSSDAIRWGHSQAPHAVVVATERAHDEILAEATSALAARLNPRSTAESSGIDPTCGA